MKCALSGAYLTDGGLKFFEWSLMHLKMVPETEIHGGRGVHTENPIHPTWRETVGYSRNDILYANSNEWFKGNLKEILIKACDLSILCMVKIYAD